jgi:hypothetical protein
MYDIAKQNLSQLERIGNLQETFGNSLSTMLATGEYGNVILQTLADGNEKLYGVNDASKNETLKLLSINNTAMNETNKALANSTKATFEKAQAGDLPGALTGLKDASLQSFDIIKQSLGAAYADKSYTEIMVKTGVNTLVGVGVEMVNNFKDFLTGKKDLTSLFAEKDGKDIAVTADGVHYSLDKGDMLMAINQQKLASAIGASSPSPILPTAVENNYASNEVKKESTPKELNVNINFTHESKGADINVAQEFSKSLRDNTSLQQQLVQQISENIKNYGLTA